MKVLNQTAAQTFGRLIVSGVLCLCFTSAAEAVRSQETDRPIEERQFLKALNRRAITLERWKLELNTHGVAFPVTAQTEAEIRRRGSYLGKHDVETLLGLVRNSYRPSERLRVSLLRYTPCENHFDQFAALLNSKINALPSMLILRDGRSSYTAGLKLVKEEHTPTMSLHEANEYWEKTRSLQVLQGICASKGSDVYVISQVFLGDLHGTLGDAVRIEFKVDPTEFGTTRDIHSLLLLYSLAKEAQLRGMDRDLVIAFLSEALGISAQIRDSDPASLNSIRSAIQNTLHQLGASDLTVLASPQK